MSTQNRKNAASKAPVSSHPLFPAIVALWFGALFGLGSLAVRVSLIESLIISSHIDVFVPMAAPPLGMTARILIALTMAMIGIGAGALIARQIARPKVAAPNRRRTAGSVSEARKEEFVRQVQIQQEEQRIAADKADAVRRRALASGDEDPYSMHRDMAPLPGGAPQIHPQILDVTQFDLAKPGSFETDLAKAQADEAPLDLAGFDPPHVAEATFAVHVPTEVPTPVLESYGDDTDSFRAKFGNEKKPVEWTPEPPPSCAATYVASDEAGDVEEFSVEVAEPLALTDAFAESPEALADDLAQGAPEAAAVPEMRRFDGPAASAVTSPIASPVDFAAPFIGVQPFANEALAPCDPEPETAASIAVEPEAVVAPFLPQGSAAERIASADLAELSPVELVERFALALKQRRHTGAFPAGLLETAAALDLPVRPQPSQVPEMLTAMAPADEPVAALETDIAEPVAVEAAATLAAAVAAAPLFAASASAESEIDDAPVAAMRLPLTLPAAMRPIEFGHQEEHDDLPDYVPPRSFAMPRLAGSSDLPEAAPLAASAAAMPAEAGFEADVNEEGYSSLLALTKSAPLRQTFVRIEEPDSEISQVEPVVIFPGQATRPGTRFSRPSENAAPVEPPAAPIPSLAEVPPAGASALRRFDAPGGAAPAAAAGTGGMQDPAEAERALRSALATLQRMSGAA